MTTAILFALLSLFLTALNDFVFKLFADKMRSRGGFVALVGLFWLIAQLFFPCTTENFRTTLFWGIVSGFMSVAGNILLIEAMGVQSAGLCSTIYRMNMVFVVLGGYFLLGEQISPMHWCGIVLALFAIIAFLPHSSVVGFSRLGFGLAVLAAVLRSIMGLSYRYGFEHGADKNTVVMINCMMWIVGGFLYSIFRERSLKWLKDPAIYKYSAISGVLVGGIVFGMAGSLKLGNASRVLPIAQMSFILTFILSVIFLKEKCDMRKILAMASGVGAVVLLAF
ncbi:MAG: EamA family transporter [Victivallales bacterium]|nr:EamA family transporter [Victivallales bacterium]